MKDIIISDYENHSKKLIWIKDNYENLKKDDWRFFIICMSHLKPQSYGAKIQNRLIEELNFKKVKSNENQGDFQDPMGDFYELKVSLTSREQKNNIHLVQIRPWQNSNYYFMAFLLTPKDVYGFCFRLNHYQMLDELKLTKASAAHGTKKSNESNSNIEYRLTFPIDPNNETFLRWFKNYRSNFFDNKPEIKSPKYIEDIININY